MAHAEELQVQIDDVYSCPGHCAGCMLSTLERRLTGPDMPAATLARALAAVEAYVRGLPRLDRLNLTFGLADHLHMDDAYLADLYARGAAVVAAADPRDRAHSAVFMTMAMIGRQERLANRLQALASRSRDSAVPLIPVVILDPALHGHPQYGAIYEGLILAARAWFGKVDLSINISTPAIAQVSPQALVAFTADHGFDEITVNWVPTDGNAAHTLDDLPALEAWLIALDQAITADGRISCSYRPVLQRSVAAVLCKRPDPGAPVPVAEVARDLVPRTIARSIQIDHRGDLLAKFEAIGDVPHASRFGFPSLGNIADAPIATLLERGLRPLAARVAAAHARSRACLACDVADICAATGFHVFNRLAEARPASAGAPPRAEPARCPHVARGLIHHYLAQAVDPVRAAAA